MNAQKRNLGYFFHLILFPLLIAIGLVWVFILGVRASEPDSHSSIGPSAGIFTPFPKLDDRPAASPRILSNDGRVIVLEFTTPFYDLKTSTSASGPCQIVYAPDLTIRNTPGQPRLPAGGSWIGIPPSGDLKVDILEAQAVIVPLEENLCPVQIQVPELPGQDSGPNSGDLTIKEIPNPSLDEFLPRSSLEFSSPGFIRSQRVAMLGFNPFQYNSVTRQLKYYPTIRVQIQLPDFTNDSLHITNPPDEGPFETVLRETLLNYDQALEWRNLRAASANAMGGLSDKYISPSMTTSISSAYKIVVDQDGIYKVSYEDLSLAGIPVDQIDPTTLVLENQGAEVPIAVVANSGNALAPGDYFVFYGQKAKTKYTDDNIYWLTWGGNAGKRITSFDGSPNQGFNIPLFFTSTIRIEENHVHLPMASAPENDYWYWEYMFAQITNPPTQASLPFTFTIDHLSSYPMTGTLQGDFYSVRAQPQHHTQIYLNDLDHLVSNMFWTSGVQNRFSSNFTSTYLIEGQNVITVVAPLDVSTQEYYFINWFKVTYPRAFIASGDQLDFPAQTGNWKFRLTGFSTSAIQILDISNPAQPYWISGATIEGASPVYTATFEQSSTWPHRFLAFTPQSYLQPKAIVKDIPSNLHDPSNQVDYIIISPSDFITAITPLANYRQSQGLKVKIVDLQDVYDEFGYGLLDPNAIHNFLAFAYASWTPPAPLYVLLVGDGHFDYKNYMGYDAPNPMPPLLGEFEVYSGETPSDNRLVSFDSSHLPSMFIARLPARSDIETTQMVDKIIGYEQTPYADWMQKVTFVADKNDPYAGNFPTLSDSVADHELPSIYIENKIYLGVNYSTTLSARTAIFNNINEGRLIVSYVGHGGPTQWASPSLLQKSQVATLTNNGKYPFMVPMTCLEGYFINPDPPGGDDSSLGEAIVREAGKGAIASFSPSGQGLATGHDKLERGLFRAFFQDYVDQIGPATTQAKLYMMAVSGGIYQDLVDTYILFGDPATSLPLLRPDPGISMSGAKLDPVGLDYYVRYSLVFTNTGPGLATHVVISDTLPVGVDFSDVISSGIPITLTSIDPLNFSVADLEQGASGRITITARVLGGYSGMLINYAHISSSGELASTMADNYSQFAIPFNSPDVAIALDGSLKGTSLQQHLIYTMIYTNAGDKLATNVVISDTLPVQLENVQVIHSGAPVTQVSSIPLVFQVADLEIGAGGRVTVTADVVPEFHGLLRNIAEINALGDSNYPFGNNRAESLLNILYHLALPIVRK